MRRSFPWLLLLTACSSDGDYRRRPDGTGVTSGTPAGSTTGAGTTSAGTATGSGVTTTTDYDCSQPVPAPPFTVVDYPIRTQEDFDFSLGGYLVYQWDIAVVGTNKQAQQVVLSPGTAGDPRGVHGLADGRIVIMSPWDGAIKVADPATGSLEVLAGSLNTPNGVEVDSNDRIYFTTYGEVGWTEADGSAHDVIYTWPGGAGYLAPNGTVLSADEQVLTVAVPTASETQLVQFERLGPDEWGPPVIAFTLPGFFSGIDQDVCGNLYTADYWGGSGDVVRIEPDGTMDVIGHVNGTLSAVRFGSGRDGWERDHLYVTARGSKVYDLAVGIPGRRHPTTP